ncbi:type II toxin-antitoxin system Phd/YefM family antitoxin [Rhizobium sp. TRM95796]|uniref:type II toxin-antitoxin system Phd/YefM family antitoxin n=1 Tax=Rhizobium sp. TRM95796 TaxID=2979862 RepID=UPI0021E8574A|nr:type II toxin-antitoxin system prevent-host-death family antitoxin [Rhizobium sp. TRM95796]MCV3765556.1 type II toxin-antitoxin system prevent-host-death family antitoxin [Rhizobium sp. TRM95796]
MKVTIEEAQSDLARLIEQSAETVQDVTIADGDRPVATIVAWPKKRKFHLGILKDQLKGDAPDFLEPMSEEELRLWEGG